MEHPEDYEPPEHIRYFRYLAELAAADDDLDLIARILDDPDKGMAQSAVAKYLDRRALSLLRDRGFPAWSAALAPVIAGYDFLVLRLHEWNLMRTVAIDGPWTNEQLFATTGWFQRNAVEIVDSPRALTLFAAEAPTRRVRNTAAQRLKAMERRPRP
ncbi:hypothetical protein [Herbidospora sp. RD11066]